MIAPQRLTQKTTMFSMQFFSVDNAKTQRNEEDFPFFGLFWLAPEKNVFLARPKYCNIRQKLKLNDFIFEKAIRLKEYFTT